MTVIFVSSAKQQLYTLWNHGYADNILHSVFSVIYLAYHIDVVRSELNGYPHDDGYPS